MHKSFDKFEFQDTRELPALERLKNQYNFVNTLGPSFLIVSPSFLQIQPWTVELAVLDRLKNLLSLELF